MSPDRMDCLLMVETRADVYARRGVVQAVKAAAMAALLVWWFSLENESPQTVALAMLRGGGMGCLSWFVYDAAVSAAKRFEVMARCRRTADRLRSR